MQRSKRRAPRRVPRFVALEARTMMSVDVPTPATFDALRFDRTAFAPDRVLVSYWADAPGVASGEALAPTLLPSLRVVSLPDGVSVPQAVASLSSDPRVLRASPDYQVSVDRAPNEKTTSATRYGQLYGLQKIGAEAAWDRTTGDPATVVAVIDTGIDYNHPDLAANIWTNAGEVPGNGVDDDANGLIDDIRGWDFVSNDNDPMDDHGHGTHVAGTIGAVGNNGIGVVGVNWNVKLMALKFLNSAGNGSTSGAIAALDYAVKMGARVSNNSYGGDENDPAFIGALQAARDANHVFVAAAGNAATSMPSYPGGYPNDNIISVAATDSGDNLASFSNYGPAYVDLAAPGVGILSTVRGGGYAQMSGTSMASPHVAGAAAMLVGLHPDWSYTQVIAKLLATVDSVPALNGKVATGGRLNLARAVNSETTGPKVVGIRLDSATGSAVGSLVLTFSEPIVPSSVTLADVASLTGPSGALGATAVSVLAGSGDREVEVRFGRVDPGTYTVVLRPDVLDTAGNLMDQDGDGVGGRAGDTYTGSAQAIGTQAPASMSDGGFEAPEAGPAGVRGSHLMQPPGTAWAFAGTAGVSANGSGYTAGNPAAPEGDQVAFLQRNGSISQAIDVPAQAAGSYRLGFRAAQRGNWQQGGYHDFSVRVDGAEVARIRPAGVAFGSHQLTLDLTAGTHTVSFVGLNSAGGDNTSLLDAVTLAKIAPAATAIEGGGFEAPEAGPAGVRGSHLMQPPGTAWAFAGTAGVSANGSGYTAGNPAAPEGDQVAFLQRNGSISQGLTLPEAGVYRLAFAAAQRGNWQQGGYHDFDVMVDGAAVARIRAAGTAYEAKTLDLPLSAGSHTVAFVGVNSAGGDNTSLLDRVSLQLVERPSGALAGGGFEAPDLTPPNSLIRPAGTPWAFEGTAGVSANGSGYTAGNPPAPEGDQVALIQRNGRISQAVQIPTAAAGTYRLSFLAAQRGNWQEKGWHDFDVLLDNVAVARVRVAGTGFEGRSLTLPLSAGLHTIAFVGVNSATGDNTSLLDAVALSRL